MKGLKIDKDVLKGRIRISYKDQHLEMWDWEWDERILHKSPSEVHQIAYHLLQAYSQNGSLPVDVDGSTTHTPATVQMCDEKLRQLKALHDAFAGNPEMQKEILDSMVEGSSNYSARDAKKRAAEISWGVDSKQQVDARRVAADTMWQKYANEYLRGFGKQQSAEEHFKKMYMGSFDKESPWAKSAAPKSWDQDSPEFFNWYKDLTEPQKRKPEEKIMANKFLPFIVDKSTPDHVYRTLLSRSKGMNINLVTSIFYMVMDEGVDELRTFVKTLPESISVQQMYEEMTGAYNKYHIMDEDLRKFLGAAQFMSVDDWNTIPAEVRQDLDEQDIMAFLYVMWKRSEIEKYTTLNFDSYFDDADDVMKNVQQYLTFSDNGDVMEFASDNELRAFIMYHALLKPKGAPTLPPIKVVFKKDES